VSAPRGQGHAPRVLGVAGAGTMGAGIAQLGCAAGIRTLLFDPVAEGLERGAERTREGLGKWAQKGPAAADAGELLQPTAELGALAECELVIEAAPERADLKRELFGRLSEICSGDAVLATNTSSIPVTSLAGAAARPENVVGMHFFNPPPLMQLLEVIRADQTSDRALEVARATGEAMGKQVILATDGPGFLVNRCGRPFYTEALRLVQERVAPPDQVDRICRIGGGFRMGPFELMDLVGIDVGFEVAKSFTELSFGEPRWKPSPLQARMVAAGRLGRKSGRGWYDYSREPYRPADPETPQPKLSTSELRERAQAAGYFSCATASLAAQDPDATGYNVLEGLPLVELTGDPRREEAQAFFADLGFHTEWVGDAPGLVLGRIVCQLVNEAAFAVGEGVGSAADVDAGLTLGLNHPRGPAAWGEQIGLDRVLATIDGLYEERREERYRAAPLLRRAAARGTSLGG
jgi:3-hydroxybutyryl-CoA dehydrogenase